MLFLSLNFEDGSQRDFHAVLPLTIGRAPDSELRVKAWRVGRHHAKIERRAAGVFIDDLGTLSGTFVNGQRITQYGPLTSADEIIIGPCLIRIKNQNDASIRGRSDDGGTPSVRSGPDMTTSSDNQCVIQKATVTLSGPGPVSTAILDGHSITTDDQHLADGCDETAHFLRDDPGMHCEDYVRHCQRLHTVLLDALDLRRRDIASMSDDDLHTEAFSVLTELIEHDDSIPQSFDRGQLIRTVVDEAVGLGPLEPLLADERVTEIMVNRHDEIYIEAAGQLHRHAGGFSSEQAVLGVIERIVSPLGRRIDDSSPMVDARLRDGSRVNAVIPPIALRGASLTIRKFPGTRPGMSDLLRAGALDVHMSRFLTACVAQRKNIIVSGGTGSGKTTLLNILSNCIPAGERIVTIEDAAELQLGHPHLVRLESRPANLEGRGAVLIRDLVRNALRMRPDRIVVGECRGVEAFDMLAAMNTGHEGSLTTLHANSARDALSRLETMILMAGMDLPLAAVREQISSSVDIIVQQARLSTGHRVITSVVQVAGQESGRIQLQELFRFHPGPPAVFIGCGIVPDDMNLTGNDLSVDLFNHTSEASMSTGHWLAAKKSQVLVRPQPGKHADRPVISVAD